MRVVNKCALVRQLLLFVNQQYVVVAATTMTSQIQVHMYNPYTDSDMMELLHSSPPSFYCICGLIAKTNKSIIDDNQYQLTQYLKLFKCVKWLYDIYVYSNTYVYSTYRTIRNIYTYIYVYRILDIDTLSTDITYSGLIVGSILIRTDGVFVSIDFHVIAELHFMICMYRWDDMKIRLRKMFKLYKAWFAKLASHKIGKLAREPGAEIGSQASRFCESWYKESFHCWGLFGIFLIAYSVVMKKGCGLFSRSYCPSNLSLRGWKNKSLAAKFGLHGE